MKVAQTCLALHVSHQFTHFAATDGGKDHEDKLEEDGKYVPNPRVAYGVFEGPTRFGRRVPGDAQLKEPNGSDPVEKRRYGQPLEQACGEVSCRARGSR